MHQSLIQGNSCFKGTSTLAIVRSRLHEMHLLHHSFLILTLYYAAEDAGDAVTNGITMIWPLDLKVGGTS